MKITNWVGLGWALGLALFLTACSGDAGAEEWQIDRSANGAACHVRTLRGGKVLPETPNPYAKYPSRKDACQAALTLSEGTNRPCLVFSDAAQKACAPKESGLNSSALMAGVGVLFSEPIVMKRFPKYAQSLDSFRAPGLMTVGRCTSEQSFPAAFVFPFLNKKGEPDFCTANLVGPRAMITAKHCVADLTVKYLVFLDQNLFAAGSPSFEKLKCEPSETVELAICAPDNGDSFKADHFEKVSLDEPKSNLTIAGFGFGKFGDIHKGPKAGFFTGPATLKTPASAPDNFMTLSGPILVRGGDSGGPVLDRCDAKRTIVGFIESAIGTSDQSTATQNSAAAVAKQLQKWANEASHGICGVTPGLDCATQPTVNCQMQRCTFASVR